MKNVVLLAVSLAVFAPRLEAQRCAACNLAITSAAYLVTDKVTGEMKHICLQCSELRSRCYLCGLPIKSDGIRLPDGRELCARDRNGVVLDDDDAKAVCAETRAELARLYSRFLSFPETNVTLRIVDKLHMEELFQTAGFDRECPSIFGYIRTRPDRKKGPIHAISLLSGLPKARLMATCAHELTHAWLDEHLPADRHISQDAVEGFCELIAFKLMVELGQQPEMQIIRANHYTRGQTDLFINADNGYGFYAVVEWVTAGQDPSLTEADPDRVRHLGRPNPASHPLESARFYSPAPTPVPDTLTLIGIVGTGDRRLALINDRSLKQGESGKVRVGATNVVVRCLEIGSESVAIEVDGSPERKELRLKSGEAR